MKYVDVPGTCIHVHVHVHALRAFASLLLLIYQQLIYIMYNTGIYSVLAVIQFRCNFCIYHTPIAFIHRPINSLTCFVIYGMLFILHVIFISHLHDRKRTCIRTCTMYGALSQLDNVQAFRVTINDH